MHLFIVFECVCVCVCVLVSVELKMLKRIKNLEK